jgi:hypothetical protein
MSRELELRPSLAELNGADSQVELVELHQTLFLRRSDSLK